MTDHGSGGGPVGGAFGDEGHFVPGPPDDGGPHTVHWPTVLASAGAAAVVAAIILSIGVIGMHRPADNAAQPAVVRVVTEGAAQADPPAEAAPPEDGSPGTAPQAEAPAAGHSAPDAATSGGSGETRAAVPGGADSGDAGPGPASSGPALGAAGQDDPAADAGASDANSTDGALTPWQPSGPLPADFAVTDPDPTLDQLNSIVYFLVANPGSDAAKARSLEAGQAGAIVPKTVYNLGIFRAPRGGSRVTGPIQRGDDRVTAQLHSFSAGMPGVDMPIDFVYRDGNWRLASSSLCAGVKTVGLPIYCNG